MQPLLSWMSLFNLDYFKIRWFCFSLFFVLTFLLAVQQQSELPSVTFYNNTDTGKLPHVQFLNPCALKGKCVQGFNPAQAESEFSIKRNTVHFTLRAHALWSMGPWWGLTGLRRWRVGGGEGSGWHSPEKKNEMRVIGLKGVWFKLRRFWSVFLYKVTVRRAQQPTWFTGRPESGRRRKKNSQHASRPERILENDFQW